MIVEMRVYTAHPGKMPEFLKLYEEHGLPVQKQHLGRCVGHYVTEVGTELNTLTHMWLYDDMADRARRRAAMAGDPRWATYLEMSKGLWLKQENRILTPNAFFRPVPGVLGRE
jgi:hypothetical protein